MVRAHIVGVSDGPLPPDAPKDIPPMYIAPQVYTIRIVKIYKGENLINETEGAELHGSTSKNIKASLYTPSKGISCQVPLPIGEVYLLSGLVEENKLKMGFCDWRRKWHRLASGQLSGIRHNYRKNCHCSVGMCYGPQCNDMLKGCQGIDWSNPLKEECKRRYTYCKATSDKECQWVQTAQYERCWDDMP